MRILLVEDEPQIADFVSRGLDENGYSVDVARDGEEALEWPSVANFDIIVLDVMLPAVDGIEVCRTLRARGFVHPYLCLQPEIPLRTAFAVWVGAPVAIPFNRLASPNYLPGF